MAAGEESEEEEEEKEEDEYADLGEDEFEIEDDSNKLSEATIRGLSAAGGQVFEGEDDEDEEESEAVKSENEAIQAIDHSEGRRVSLDVADDAGPTPAEATTAGTSSGTARSGGYASYASLGAFSDAIAPLLKPTRKTLIQEQSAAERKIIRYNQGIRTTINTKLIQTFQSTQKEVAQVSHQLDLVRNVTQDLNIKIHSINDDLEKLTTTIDRTCGSFLQLLQPSLQGRTMHT